MLFGIWFYIQLYLVAITVNLLIRAHPSISVSSHKRLWHFVVTQITLNPAKCVISTRSRKSPQEAHSHLAHSRLSCWLPSKWHPYLHDFAFQGYLMCRLDWGAVDSRDQVYRVQIAEEHLTRTSCFCCRACISWPTIVVRCSGVNCCIWESTAGGRLKGFIAIGFGMVEGFGISGMPLIGKKAPTRPLGETGNTTTLFSWVPDGVVLAAVANFTDRQIKSTRESKIRLQTNFFSLRSWTSES